MNSDNITEQNSPKPVIARQKGKLGAVMIDPKTKKPIPGTWIPKSEVPEKALKYLDPEKFKKIETARQKVLSRPPSEVTGVVDPKWETQKPSQKPPATTQKPSQKPPTATQKPSKKPPTSPRTSTPKPVTQTGNKATDMASWAKANPRLAKAQELRTSGASRSEINKALYDKGTAAYGASGKSEIEKQADELRSMQKASQARQTAQSGPMYSSPDVRSKMSKRTKTILGLPEQYDACDIVLEYLFLNGHVETLDEALYIMMQMDSEFIKDIVEAGPLLPGEPGKAPTSGYKEPILPGEERKMKYMKKPTQGQTQKLPPA